MNIAIGIPSVGVMRIETAVCMCTSIVSLRNHSVGILTRESCYIHQNREYIVDEARKMKAKVLLYVDTDMVFPPDTFSKLVKRVQDGYDIVGVNYLFRQFPLKSTFRVLPEKRDVMKTSADIPDDIFEVEGVGTGIMAINMDVFDKISRPYFFFDEKEGYGKVGDDMYFCFKAREAGLKVHVDPTIPVGHIGTYLFQPPQKQ